MSTTTPDLNKRVLNVALAGNPNSGKTTVFNALTRLRQKVGNYPGVTVEKKMGRVIFDLPDESLQVNILDLPGTYSLAVRSPDEKVARDVLMGHMPDTPKPDLVICVIDASNLERNLYFMTQIQDLGLPVIGVLNMMDTVTRQGKTIDIPALEKAFGIPFVATVASQEKGFGPLQELLKKGVRTTYQRGWRMPERAEEEVSQLTAAIAEHNDVSPEIAFSDASLLISREQCRSEDLSIQVNNLGALVSQARERLEKEGINWRSVVVESRYQWIHSVLERAVKEPGKRKLSFSDRLDAILIHKFWGWVFFIGMMAVMFFMIFSVANYPMDWIDSFFAGLSDLVRTFMPAGDLRDLLTDGIIAGVGGVVIFLPQILILFFFIGLMQDTGYMARAAFIMDRLMSKVGLHGKSFIPLLSSFACAIPGIMATRSIESPKDRLVTILVAPLMSCSARLPVYTLLIATLIPGASAFEKAGIMLSMYLLGVLGAFTVAGILKKTLLKGETPVLIMELPPYRLPAIKSVILHMWERSRLFLRRAGTIIFGLSIVLWALMSYPKHPAQTPHQQLEMSFAGQAGRIIEPIIKPLGYDWRVGIGLVGSFAAREVFVSTMNIVFNVAEADDQAATPLRDAFRKAQWPDGRPLFTPLVCISLMVFYVFAMQCLSTVAIVKRETNSWKWPLFQIAYMTTLAYAAGWAVYHGGRLLGYH